MMTPLNPAKLYVQSLTSSVSRQQMHLKLSQLARLNQQTFETFAWTEITPAWVLDMLIQLEDQGLAYASINLYLSAIKGVAREAWRNNLLDGDTLAKIKDIANRKGSRLPAGRALPQQDIDQLLTLCAQDPISIRGSRDALILMLGFYMGLRRSEIGQIKVADLELNIGFLKIIGKGNKQRELPIPNILLPYLNNWLSLRNQQAIEYHLTGKHLLGQVSRHANAPRLVSLDGLTGEMIRLRLKALWQKMDSNLAQAEKVPTPHDMRRTAITRWLNKGSPRSAQSLAGHSHIQTTMNYSRTDLEDEMRKTIEQ